MWIYLPTGHLSIVAHREDPDVLIVRARRREHIEALGLLDTHILATPDADYQFRYIATRTEIAEWLSNFVMTGLTQTNFKDSITDPALQHASHRLWAVAADMARPEDGGIYRRPVV